MLKLLRKILQDVLTAPDFLTALQVMVARVKEALETETCSIFLLDETTREFVLVATEGLKPSAIKAVRLKLGEGLIGLVGERGEPLNLDDAQSHPNYVNKPELGEDRFHAFLAVPIIHQGEVYGIILVQQEETKKYDPAEEALLITISAQLGGIIAEAEAAGNYSQVFQNQTELTHFEELCLEGIASSPGVGIGQTVLVYPLANLDSVPLRKVPEEEIEKEIEQIQAAISFAKEDIANLKDKLIEHIGEQERALFDAYLAMLAPQGLPHEIIEEIQTEHWWSQSALRRVIQRHVRHFENLDDGYFAERAADIRDMGTRILAYLQENHQPDIEYPQQTILIGEEISAASLAEVPEGRLVGIVSVSGSLNAHVAILARALGVPAVMGVEGLNINQLGLEQRTVIVDGYYGQVYLSPSPELLQEFEILVQEESELNTNLHALRNLPSVTPDGYPVSLLINTGLAMDAGLSLSVGAEGIGLFRTEVPFMVRDGFPTEEEQRILYRQLLNAFSPRPVIMRTLDIGGDKHLPYFPISEENPFLGWRGIRVTLDHPDVFLVQVRAMLKASVGLKNLRILLPMISMVRELEDAAELIHQAYTELQEEGFEIEKPPIGIMLEVPSSLYLIKHFAKHVDFFSVGTNDLIQYLLAVDRNNPRVAELYDALHPAVIQTLMHIVEACHLENKPVSLCGEMASDPACVIILLALGFNALSMNSVSLLRVKWIIRTLPLQKARELLREVLNMEDPKRIRYHLEQALEQAGLGGLIRAGK